MLPFECLQSLAKLPKTGIMEKEESKQKNSRSKKIESPKKKKIVTEDTEVKRLLFQG